MLMALLCGIAAGAAERPDDDAAAILTVFPSATHITRTSYGYRLETPRRTIPVNRTSYGYRINTGDGLILLNRTRSGFRVQTAR